MHNNEQSIGSYLKSVRKAKGLTLTSLSEISGVSHPYISQIENDKFTPSPEILGRLAKPLGLFHSDLLVKAGHMPVEAYDDRSLDEILYGINSEEMIITLRDIKSALEGFVGHYYYNGHELSKQDRQRMLDMLKALFPEYQDPK